MGCSESSRRVADHFDDRLLQAGSAGRKRAQIRRESSLLELVVVPGAVGMVSFKGLRERRVVLAILHGERAYPSVRTLPWGCIIADVWDQQAKCMRGNSGLELSSSVKIGHTRPTRKDDLLLK